MADLGAVGRSGTVGEKSSTNGASGGISPITNTAWKAVTQQVILFVPSRGLQALEYGISS